MLSGPRITLRLFNATDVEHHVKLYNDFSQRGDFCPDTRFFPLSTQRKEFEETGWWEENKGRMAIVDQQGQLMGYIAFFSPLPHACGYEVGYVIYRPAHRNHGYTTEALRIFSAYLFAAKPIPRLQVAMAHGHAASRRVAEKCGYQFEGTFRSAGFDNGQYVDVDVLSLLRADCPSLTEVLHA